MATLDKINSEKKGKKKTGPKGNAMANAVSSTEKIRDWVSYLFKS